MTRDLFENSPNPIWIIPRSGRIKRKIARCVACARLPLCTRPAQGNDSAKPLKPQASGPLARALLIASLAPQNPPIPHPATRLELPLRHLQTANHSPLSSKTYALKPETSSYNEAMPFKVFLSYSTDPDESAIVWRLQTLAASYDIQMFVPQRAGVRAPSGRRNAPLVSDEVRTAIENADCVLAIITSRTGTAVEKELNYALARQKVIIPIVEEGIHERAFLSRFPRVFPFSRLNGNPGRLESEVLEFLRQKKIDKEGRQAVGALVAIGAGLLLLSALAKE